MKKKTVVRECEVFFTTPHEYGNESDFLGDIIIALAKI